MSRIEKDFLGEMEIEDEAYYGVQSKRAAQNFMVTGVSISSELIHALGVVKKAVTTANMNLGYLGKEKAKAIIQAAEEVREGKFDDEVILDSVQGGAGTSINMNINEIIANRALEILGYEKGDYDRVHPNTDVNMAQSTNDVIPTAIRIATLRKIDGLIEATNLLDKRLIQKEEEFDDVLKMGRTQLQDAVPIRLGQEFGAYRKTVERFIDRIKEVRNDLTEINLGATAVGTGLNADPKYIELAIKELRKSTGLKLESTDNLIDGTQNTDIFVEVSGRLKTFASSLSKIANDLRLLDSGPKAGLNEINLPAVQPGSSIMPGKVNPVIPEMVNQASFQVLGNDQTITLASEAGQLELNVMVPVIVFNLLQSINILTNVNRIFAEKCIKDITVNKERCEEFVDRSVGVVTALNPHIGYAKACEVAKKSLREDRPVKEIILEEDIMDEEKLSQILNPVEMTEPGIAGKQLLPKEA
ncbi:aspartate ammonia-lyase [Acetohalobium arabaticum]|uniref:aspartate ammonia-lyase n=1 Tax=Acetohalobium arabaticum (strain ATCC 49924 / DSM 5501 / Z-7288) TaxID=574087 RepID=D9QV05_ACEAZ|nr:aspartate ammonia-lyase [Acetohalobium arabaticum]ADL12064.1 fumarase [Acetohalobium arabaticum DSM 5501]